MPNASTALSLSAGRTRSGSGGTGWSRSQDEFPNHYLLPGAPGQAGVELVETPWEVLRCGHAAHPRWWLISTVNYSTGFRPPLEEIAPKFLRDRGVFCSMWMARRAWARCEFDTSTLRPDMFAVHGYKWMLSPNGAGFCLRRSGTAGALPAEHRGLAQPHGLARRPERLHHGEPSFRSTAEKYEGGMLTFPPLYAMGAR